MEDQRILHYFINSVNNFPVCSQPAQVPVEEVIVTEDIVDAIDPNQISLLDQIADMEADMMDENIRYTANEAEERVLTEHELAHQLYGVDNDIEVSIAALENEELNDEEEIYDEIEIEELALDRPEESILQYTDKDGNTFESIEFHNAAVETSLEEDIEDLIADKETNELEANLNILENKKDYDSGSDFDLDFNTNDIEENEEQSDFF
jgi:hypothetical protein